MEFIVVSIIAVLLTLYMMKKGINVGIVMLVDSVFVVLLARIPAVDALWFAYNGLISDKTIKLIMVLFLIMMLENIMRTTGMIKTMVESLKELVGSNRLAAAFLPAVIGLLPSPGGARFSCPMIEELVGDNTDNENKAFINYWFRHIWLDGFILYPGAILAAELLEVSVINLFISLIPFMAVSVLLGSVFGLVKVKKEIIPRTKPWVESLKTFLVAMLPVIIVIAVYIGLLKYTGYSLEIAAGLMVIALLIIKKYSPKQIVETAKSAFPLKLVLIIIGVMIFKEILFDSGAMNGLPDFMKAHNIPTKVLFLLLPFLGGFATGITVSYVSMTFPVLLTLGMGENLWYAAIAFTAGYIGNMITPMHLCAVMTADYFKSTIGRLLVKIAIATLPMLLLVFILLFII